MADRGFQITTSRKRPMATIAFFFPAAKSDPPIPLTQEGIGATDGDGGIAQHPGQVGKRWRTANASPPWADVSW